MNSIDWRYFRDALSPEEALDILDQGQRNVAQREREMCALGPMAYSTSGWSGLTNEQIQAHINALRGAGFRHFKTKVGSNLDDDLERLTRMREWLDDDAALMTDANQIWGVDEAIEWMGELARFRPFWIEEPTARDDVLGYRKIRSAMEPLGIGVAAGEAVLSPVLFKQLMASGAITHCQIDATRLAGVNDVLAVILMAAKFKVPVCPHGGGIGLCNMIRHYAIWDQLSVGCEREGRLVEYLDFLQADVFEHPIATNNGAYVVPREPGWGLEMKPEFIERHRFPTGSVWRGRQGPIGPAFVA